MEKKYILKNKNNNKQKIFTDMKDLKDFIIWQDANEEWELINVINEVEIKEKRNSKTKSVGNGEGSLYYSETLKCWVYQDRKSVV